MGLVHSPKIVTDGLVLALDAGNVKSYPGSGTTWYDKSGNGNNGTLTNGPTFASGSIVFDGVDDYVTCGNPASLQITGSITLSTWINTPALFSSQNYPPFIIKGVNISYMLYGNSVTNQVRIRIGSNISANVLDSIATFSINTWYNIIGTYDGSAMKIYVNGVFDSQKSLIGTIPTGSNNVYLGFNPIGEAIAYNGKISSTQIYNRALTQAEITQNFNALKSRFGL